MATKCEDCDQPATVHFVAPGAHQEIHLCRPCAARRHLVSAKPTEGEESAGPQPASEQAGQCHADLARLACPDCGVRYMEFRKLGRLGCPFDYVAFRAGLLPLLDRVHAATHHKGKRPRARPLPVEAHQHVRQLRRQLRLAVEAEDFALAARLRDGIRAKEGQYGA